MRPATLLWFALLSACSLRPYTWDGGTDSTTIGSTITDPTTTTPTSTATSSSTTSTTLPATSEPSSSGCGFLDCRPEPDTPADNDCDGWLMPIQDCPEGQKCTFEGEFWDTHCVDVVPTPKGMYEPCQLLMDDWLGGYDDCGPGLFCWDVSVDTGIGTCIGLCQGPSDSPSCVDPNASCVICQDCAIGLCMPGCDPIVQDCHDGDLCIPQPMGDHFVCVLDASGDEGQAFDPCEYANACDPGLLCANPTLASECDPMAAGCCLPFCDLNKPTCPGQGQICLPWYEPGMGPPALEKVGLCRLPP